MTHGVPPPPPPKKDYGVHYLWFAFVCFLIRSYPPPPNDPRIMDHLPHNPPPPPPLLPNKMIHNFPDHPRGHVIHQFVIKKNDPTGSNSNTQCKYKEPYFGSYFFHTN